MKMSSCFGKCLCFCKTEDSDGKQKGKNVEKPVVIRGHDHPLLPHDQKERGSTYECKGCQQLGFGPYYSCINCNVHYHKHCGDLLRPDISSAASAVRKRPPYPTGYLVLKEKAPSRAPRCCVACGDRVLGLRYKVRRRSSNPFRLLSRHLNNRAFHPLCASLPKQIKANGQQEIVLELEKKIRGECLICKDKARGWAYNSTCGLCCYHVGCVKRKIIQSWQEEEAPGKRGKKKNGTIIYVKRAGRVTLEIAKWAFLQIIQALFWFPAPMVEDLIAKLFDFIFE
ncbi:hypothetical protein BT93_G2262 [Corymbia citriodora subsp. variegata]|nr:hypothetical protein BT93_G2262 [Corymbia citriodora subsp. variegata]